MTDIPEIWNLSALCRCCHSDGYFKSLQGSYVFENEIEIYSEMLRETLNVEIKVPPVDASYTICDACILRLRDAYQFKTQVSLCERKFEEYCKNELAGNIEANVSIKSETEFGLFDDDDNQPPGDVSPNYEIEIKCDDVFTKKEEIDAEMQVQVKSEEDNKATIEIQKEKVIKKDTKTDIKKRAGRKIITMVVCIFCSSDLHYDCQYYNYCDMGPEIMTAIENSYSQEVDENGTVCADCFANIMQIMSAAHDGSSAIQEEYRNVCVWCQSSLYSRRTHHLPASERKFVAESIFPRTVLDGSLVCHACWCRVRQFVKQQEDDLPLESTHAPAITSNSCVWCLRSLARTRRHFLPEGPERNEIIARIYPREIPPQGRVCYACWVAARRNVQRAHNIDEARDGAVFVHHHNDSCGLCNT